MKAAHLLLVVIITFSLGFSALSGNALAASEKKEVTTPPVDKVAAPLKVTPDDKKSATKATKGIPKDVNINTADKEMLILLPGIGPVAAEAILAYRKDNGNFKSVDELTKVKGIGDKTLEKLKPYLQKI
jgi:competence protein ComEA